MCVLRFNCFCFWDIFFYGIEIVICIVPPYNQLACVSLCKVVIVVIATLCYSGIKKRPRSLHCKTYIP